MQEESTVFWQLVEEHRAGLWRFALGLTHSREDARDLVGETVLAAHRSFSKLRDHAAFQKSLMTIAIRLYRRQRWRGRIFRDIDEAREIATVGTRESNYDLDLLTQALGRLPERQREAVLLFEISGLSIEEIRSVQGGTLSGVKARLKRGREALRLLMLDDVNQKLKRPDIPDVLAATIF
jgi:RNA polymerase sigma-70 factor (ECF subfamily)